ncbi:MAG: response UmuD protein [Francisellaceae bacterium]|nr:response UmuD protein [Francisellaceae bacterium]
MHKKVSHGGIRPGAGRPKNTGRFGEPTKLMRVPYSRVKDIKAWLTHQYSSLEKNDEEAYHNDINVNASLKSIPLFSSHISAGFPSQGDDYIDKRIDLNEFLVKEPTSTFLIRVEGTSMINAGIYENDLLVVDKSLEAKSGKIIIAVLNGEFTVKRLKIKKKEMWLIPENDSFEAIKVSNDMEFHIWGVVTNVIHKV